MESRVDFCRRWICPQRAIFLKIFCHANCSVLIALVLLLAQLQVSRPLYAGTLIYTVEEGDTLEAIAKRFQVSVAALLKINRFGSLEQGQSSIVRGQSILIPSPTVQLAQAPSSPATVAPENPRVLKVPAPPLPPDQSGAASPQTDSENRPENRAGASRQILTEQANPSRPLVLHTIANPSRIQPPAPASYTVETGDTLLAISRKTQVALSQIRALNQLQSDIIRPGQVLRLEPTSLEGTPQNSPQNPPKDDSEDQLADLSYHRVVQGDTLSSIGRKYDISLKQLRRQNQLGDIDLLRIGKRLLVARSATNSAASAKQYTVQSGDTLWAIARRFQTSVLLLEQWNAPLSATLHPGQVLAVSASELSELSEPPQNRSQNTAALAQSSGRLAIQANADLQATARAYTAKEQQQSQAQQEAQNKADEQAYQRLQARRQQKATLKPPGGLPQKSLDPQRPLELAAYFSGNPPRLLRQPNAGYYEEFPDDPLENYQTARKLLAQFDTEITALPKLGDTLSGYAILIDPGHGGLDPGFNSQSKDGSGNPLYIIEDEYNYDYALRLYRLFSRHGAQVGLTIISPNQQIVDSPDASRTLVSQKNEVYNSPFVNQRGEYSSWPVGTASGLRKRTEVAESFFNGTKKASRIFISLHNDNSPWDTDGRLVLYYDDALTVDQQGRELAQHLLPFLGKNAHFRGQELAVLRQNPARYAVLVELRNIAYPRNSWAIRNADLRQEDVQMLGEGILSFVRSLAK